VETHSYDYNCDAMNDLPTELHHAILGHVHVLWRPLMAGVCHKWRALIGAIDAGDPAPTTVRHRLVEHVAATGARNDLVRWFGAERAHRLDAWTLEAAVRHGNIDLLYDALSQPEGPERVGSAMRDGGVAATLLVHYGIDTLEHVLNTVSPHYDVKDANGGWLATVAIVMGDERAIHALEARQCSWDVTTALASTIWHRSPTQWPRSHDRSDNLERAYKHANSITHRCDTSDPLTAACGCVLTLLDMLLRRWRSDRLQLAHLLADGERMAAALASLSEWPDDIMQYKEAVFSGVWRSPRTPHPTGGSTRADASATQYAQESESKQHPNSDQRPSKVRGPCGFQGFHGGYGSQGIRGPQGVGGPQGLANVQAVQVPHGITGPRGVQGMIGPRGSRGCVGVAGCAGPFCTSWRCHPTIVSAYADQPCPSYMCHRLLLPPLFRRWHERSPAFKPSYRYVLLLFYCCPYTR